MKSILREVTPLSDRDCYLVFSREKEYFSFPIHIHTEFELNLIENGTGAKRIVGDSMEDIEDLELTLVAPNLEHAWLQHNCKSKKINEVTIQFHADLLNESLLQKNQFRTVREMLEAAQYGVTFSKETIVNIKDKIHSLAREKKGVHSVLLLFGILYDLSLSPIKELSSHSFNATIESYDSRRVEKAYSYMLANYNKNIRLADLAELVGMTSVSFSRFLKLKTGRNFIDSLNDIRLGHATRLLIDTTHSILEICLNCGFNNITNFNRIFKNKKGCTPSAFREKYKESKFYF